MKILKFSFFALLFGLTFSAYAENYVAIGKEGKVYDEPNTKYVTLNQNNEEINVIPGMAFKQLEKSPGWYMIEYSPGLRAYIQEPLTVKAAKEPTPGVYTVSNDSSKKLDIQKTADGWTALIDGKSYKGKAIDNIIIFDDDSGKPIYSAVDTGSGTIAITYLNDITKFF